MASTRDELLLQFMWFKVCAKGELAVGALTALLYYILMLVCLVAGFYLGFMIARLGS